MIILSEFTNVVNYDSDNGWTTLFDKFKKEVPEISEDVKAFFDLYSQEPKETIWDTKRLLTFANEVGGVDDSFKKFLSTADTSGDLMEQYQQHLSKASSANAKFSATLKSTAANMAIMLAVNLVIQGITKIWDNYVNRVEHARKRTDELFDEFKQMDNTLASHKKTVSDLADRYEELSKGVDLADNKNKSLSTAEYEEFLNINRQLADSFPQLIQGIDENGNSILTLGTKGTTAREQLEELLKTEEELNNFRIAQNLGEAFEGVYTYIEEADKAADELENSIADANAALNKFNEISENGIGFDSSQKQLIFSGDINNGKELNYISALTESANDFWKLLDPSRKAVLDQAGTNPSNLFTQEFNQDSGVFEIYARTYGLSSKEIAELEQIIKDNTDSLKGDLADSIDMITYEAEQKARNAENKWKDFIPNLVSGMKAQGSFKGLEDPDLQDIHF